MLLSFDLLLFYQFWIQPVFLTLSASKELGPIDIQMLCEENIQTAAICFYLPCNSVTVTSFGVQGFLPVDDESVSVKNLSV